MTKLPAYYQKYLDERFGNVNLQLAEILDILKGEDSLIKRVRKNSRWIQEMSGKLTVIATFTGAIFAIVFSTIKEAIAKMLK